MIGVRLHRVVNVSLGDKSQNRWSGNVAVKLLGVQGGGVENQWRSVKIVPRVVQLREINLNSDQNYNWQPEDKWRARDRQLLEKAWHPRVESEQCAKEIECRWGWRQPRHGKRGALWTGSLSGELKGEAAGLRPRVSCRRSEMVPREVRSHLPQRGHDFVS